MQENFDDLREIERLLREAEKRLGSAPTFRLRTLLQMSLFELQRNLDALDREKEAGRTPEVGREHSGD